MVLSCDISFMNKDDEVGIQLHSFENAYTAIYRKQKRDDLADQHMDEHLDSYISGVWGLYKVMAWINWLSEHPEIKKVEKDSPKEQNRRKPAQEKRSAPQQKEKALPTTREIRINGIRVVSSDEKLVRKLGSKVRQRLTETWGVRGHYRHYASGKTVYISPYTKGKKDGATVKKEYRLTMADTGVTEKN